MTHTILILQNPDEIAPDQINTIRRIAPNYDIWMTRNPLEEDSDRLKRVEISTGFNPPVELILNGRLKWHHAYSAGMDWLFKIDGYRNLPAILTNSSGIHAVPISEHTFAMILAHERSLIKFAFNQSRGFWENAPPGQMLGTAAEKTMLIIGLGSIGTRVAKLAQAHDMHVIGIRRQPERSCRFVDKMHGPEDLDDLIPLADYIVCLLPKTPDTHHFIGKPQFDRMKRGVFIVNLGRGMHIDEKAMIHALESGTISGAGLDTFETEPLPSVSPLWRMKNVIISPHCAGGQPDYGYQARRLFINNLKRFVGKQTLFNIVDKRLGYSLSH